MELKEILIHRLRDFDSVMRAKKKFFLLVFIFLRQIIKIMKKNESDINFLIQDNFCLFNNFKFITRKKTLDFLFFSKYYEPETTKFLLKNNGECFIDIGAHIGRFVITSSKNYKKILALEPHPENFSQLKKNLKINRIKNVDAINFAISNKKRILQMNPLQMNTGATKINEKGTIKIKTIKLDDLIKKNKIDPKKVNIVMIDVENHELEVLEGAKDFLKKTSAILIIESFTTPKVIEILKKYGYVKKRTFDFYNHLFIKQSKNY